MRVFENALLAGMSPAPLPEGPVVPVLDLLAVLLFKYDNPVLRELHFPLSQRDGLRCESYIFPCRSEMDCVARATFSLPRGYGPCCGTQIFLVETTRLALRDFNFSCRGVMAGVARPQFFLSRRHGLLCETKTTPMTDEILIFLCPGVMTCFARPEFSFSRRDGWCCET